MLSLHLKELDLIYALQNGRTGFWDPLLKFLNFCDTQYFYLLLILFLWIFFGWKIGFRILFVLLLSAFLNDFVKSIFQMPRPFFFDSKVAILLTVDGFGFPSGGAQNACLFGLLFSWHLRKYWAYLLSFLYIGLVSFSRVYLGLHFISDIAGGLVLGYLVFLIYICLFPKIEAFLKKHSLLERFLLALTAAFVMHFLNNSSQGTIVALNFALAGVFLCLGLYFQILPDEPLKKEKRWLKRVISFLGAFIIALLTFVFHWNFLIGSLALALWLVVGVGLIFRGRYAR